jgi:hypothetical protein
MGIDLGHLDATLAEGVEEGAAARCVGELGGDEGAPNDQRGANELLDGAHSLGDEQPLPLASPPSLEVAG